MNKKYQLVSEIVSMQEGVATNLIAKGSCDDLTTQKFGKFWGSEAKDFYHKCRLQTAGEPDYTPEEIKRIQASQRFGGHAGKVGGMMAGALKGGMVGSTVGPLGTIGGAIGGGYLGSKVGKYAGKVAGHWGERAAKTGKKLQQAPSIPHPIKNINKRLLPSD